MDVLIVDDEPDITNAIAYCLLKLGVSVKTATSGREALNIILTDIPRLVLTDINMPNGDGIFLINEIRSQGLTIPVIVMSGKNQKALESEFKRLKVSQLINKPFDLEKIITIIKKFLSST